MEHSSLRTPQPQLFVGGGWHFRSQLAELSNQLGLGINGSCTTQCHQRTGHHLYTRLTLEFSACVISRFLHALVLGQRNFQMLQTHMLEATATCMISPVAATCVTSPASSAAVGRVCTISAIVVNLVESRVSA